MSVYQFISTYLIEFDYVVMYAFFIVGSWKGLKAIYFVSSNYIYFLVFIFSDGFKQSNSSYNLKAL
jgi:hypothetical protein